MLFSQLRPRGSNTVEQKMQQPSATSVQTRTLSIVLAPASTTPLPAFLIEAINPLMVLAFYFLSQITVLIRSVLVVGGLLMIALVLQAA